ncbi:putative RNA helicase [Cafeteria roenbergensis virus]|uniref:RNA helicase n=1 Tax=Cafeteria roenbergensis virus (strain BV-PW1) TaxID=693272 RepID=E3T4N8_CROVB|nr:putative RNA helicase [Cafeteria roenbergensis virus BV-PW1]ADO67151.1 putative RNA helicase [Cafeteria roenbergensis virus BV-PW1]
MEYSLTISNIELVYKRLKDKLTKLSLLNLNENKKIILEKTINKYFPQVPDKEKQFVLSCYYYLLNYIYESLFDNEQIFWEQLKSNNNQDIETLFLLLLPFLKNAQTNSIKSINNLFSDDTKINVSKYEDIDLVKVAKNLKYTNKLITLINHQKTGELIIDYRKIILTHLEITITTIRKINHKFMISWQNVFPLKFNNLELYNNTFHIPEDKVLIDNTLNNLNKLTSNPSSDKINEILMSPKGLWMGEIYQQIYQRFYISVLPSKYLIFPYLNSREGTIIYGADIVNNLIQKITGLKTIDYTKQYYDYSPDIQELMEIKFNDFKELRLDSGLDDAIIGNFFNRILLYMSFYDETSVVKLDSKFDLSLNEILLDPMDNKEKIEQIELLLNNPDIYDNLRTSKFFQKLTAEAFYQFVYQTIQKFKNTPYFRFLFKIDNKEINFNKNFNDKNNIINLKWIYNWAKSIVHDQSNDKFELMDSNIQTNHLKISKIFFNKLIPTNNKWFNIKSNIVRTYNTVTNLNYQSINGEIHQKMTDTFQNIPFYLILIFDDMIRNGVLSKFIINTNLTDKTKQPINKEKRFKLRKTILKKMFQENKQWEDCYYYWTNQPFKTLDKYSILPNQEEDTYFSKIQGFYEWSTYFSNDWVTQIDFYSHFLNQQIMYVTGATGQGKSTQVPKLTSYGTKAFLYKYDGHVIGTQPRTAPTRGNIYWISGELGIPVLKYEKVKGFTEKQEMPTDNYYLQFKYQQDKHVKNDHTLKLTMATDGTLLNEVSNSLLLKKKILINNKKTKILRNNIYEAVMIDEAHEHNPNMDLILSLMKQVCYYNPEIRLLIISATMDDDEPLYRSYYSLIDDNHCFPFRGLSMIPLFNNIFIDVNLYDRRFHISPPGGTTQYQVDEYYLPQNIEGLTDEEASKKNQLSSYQIIKEIADKNPSGEILLFLNGQNEIKKAVQKLNTILPKKTIAIPFYTRLHPKFKGIVTSIEKNISTLKVKKELIHDYWGEEYQEDKSVPNNLYDRAVIIATNVAEASLTIKRLRFVIDNGYSKEKTFDEINGESLQIQEISESSRVQRKGRVGRVGPGKSYFLYEKGGREDNPPKLKITQTDPISWMIPFIKNPNQVRGRPKIIMSSKEDFHINKNNITNIRDDTPMDIIKTCTKLVSLQKFHYQRDTSIHNPPKTYYNSMDEYKNKELLLDYNASYWIIHPREIKITRNIFYQLIKYDNQDETKIPDKQQKYTDSYLNSDKDLIVNAGSERNKFIYNSKLSSIISKIEGELGVLKPTATSILYADAFNIVPQVLLVLSIISSIRELSMLISKKDFINLQKLNKYNSDFEFLGEIAEMTLQNSPEIYQILSRKTFMKRIKLETEKLKHIYLTQPNVLELEDRIYLNKLKASGEWNNNNIAGKIIDKTKYFKNYFKTMGININLPNIFNLKKNLYVEEDIKNNFMDLFSKYLSLTFKMEMLNNPDMIKEINETKNGIKNFKTLTNKKLEEIVFCIIVGLEKNTIINLSQSNTLSYKNNLGNIKLIDRNFRFYIYKNLGFTSIPQTLVQPIILQHYYSSNVFDGINYLNYVTNIPIEWLIVLDPKYFITEFKQIQLLTKKNYTMTFNPEIAYLEKIFNNKFSMFKNYWQTRILNDIYVNIVNSYK